MMNIITRGYGNSQNIITMGYAGYVVIPGFLRRRKQVRVPFYIEYLFDVYAQIRKEFYKEIELVYPLFYLEYNKEFVIPINKEIKKEIEIKSNINRIIYKEININSELGYRKIPISTFLKILNEL